MAQEKSSRNFRSLSRRTRLFIICGAIVLLPKIAVLAMLTYGYLTFNDQALAGRVMKFFNTRAAGHLECASVHWQPRLLLDFIFDIPSPITVEKVALYDPRGDLVISASNVETKVRPRSLVVKRNLRFSGTQLLDQSYLRLARIAGQEAGTKELNLRAALRPRNLKLSSAAAGSLGLGLSQGRLIELRDVYFAQMHFIVERGDARLSFPELSGRGSLALGGAAQSTLTIAPQTIATQTNATQTIAQNFRLETNLTAKHGLLRLDATTVPIKNFRALDVLISPARPHDLTAALQMQIADVTLRAQGRLVDLLGDRHTQIEMKVNAEHPYRALPILALLASGKNNFAALNSLALNSLALNSAALKFPEKVEAQFSGLLTRPRLAVQFADGELGRAPLKISQPLGELVLDTQTSKLSLKNLSFNLLDGRTEMIADLDLKSGLVQGQAWSSNTQPGIIHPLLKGRAAWSINFRGQLLRTTSPQLQSQINLKLSRQRRDIFPRTLNLAGPIVLTPEQVDFSALRVSVDGIRLRLHQDSQLDWSQRTIQTQLSFSAPTINQWLAQRHLPALVQSLDGTMRIHGNILDPQITGKLWARGSNNHLSNNTVSNNHLSNNTVSNNASTPRPPQLSTSIEFNQRALHLKDLRADYRGGILTGSAILRLSPGGKFSSLTSPYLQAKFLLSNFELAALGQTNFGQGRLSGEITLDGLLNNLSASANLRLQPPKIRLVKKPARFKRSSPIATQSRAPVGRQNAKGRL